ncbi:hypothetical protein [Singulisphaera sp. PoT]|uniref:hypothetical protein n=1 Tax=Singulisphaera sp. PoT TaxID=3411797 RepID=UPI003BF56369
MSILTAPSRSVRVYSRLVPAKPTRRSDRPARPFGEGLEERGLSCPIDQRPLPTIQGVGLTCEESRRINGARNRAFAEYASSCPEATLIECEVVARKAATDELRRALMDRPAAPELKAPEPEPVVEAVPMGTVGKPARNHGRCKPFTSADLDWWAANSPTRNEGYVVVARRMTWERWHREAAQEVAEAMEPVGILAGHDLD